jgi:hypothetical protein
MNYETIRRFAQDFSYSIYTISPLCLASMAAEFFNKDRVAIENFGQNFFVQEARAFDCNSGPQ